MITNEQKVIDERRQLFNHYKKLDKDILIHFVLTYRKSAYYFKGLCKSIIKDNNKDAFLNVISQIFLLVFGFILGTIFGGLLA
jgi:hypothetical protein